MHDLGAEKERFNYNRAPSISMGWITILRTTNGHMERGHRVYLDCDWDEVA